MQNGFLFIISGPSAVGKSSVADEVLKTDPLINRIITCTTRKIRSNEKKDVDYHFMSRDDFFSHRDNGDFVEFSEVYGNYYGILLSNITENIRKNIDSLLVINWEGFLKIKKAIGNRVFGFFIVPPNLKDLETRIRARCTDSEDVIAARLNMAVNDMNHKSEFDFCIENADIKKAASNVLRIVNSIRNGQHSNSTSI
jgi:guanylate kinase